MPDPVNQLEARHEQSTKSAWDTILTTIAKNDKELEQSLRKELKMSHDSDSSYLGAELKILHRILRDVSYQVCKTTAIRFPGIEVIREDLTRREHALHTNLQAQLLSLISIIDRCDDQTLEEESIDRLQTWAMQLSQPTLALTAKLVEAFHYISAPHGILTKTKQNRAKARELTQRQLRDIIQKLHDKKEEAANRSRHAPDNDPKQSEKERVHKSIEKLREEISKHLEQFRTNLTPALTTTITGIKSLLPYLIPLMTTTCYQVNFLVAHHMTMSGNQERTLTEVELNQLIDFIATTHYLNFSTMQPFALLQATTELLDTTPGLTAGLLTKPLSTTRDIILMPTQDLIQKYGALLQQYLDQEGKGDTAAEGAGERRAQSDDITTSRILKAILEECAEITPHHLQQQNPRLSSMSSIIEGSEAQAIIPDAQTTEPAEVIRHHQPGTQMTTSN